MFTLIGAVIGFVAMLAARGRAGVAAGMALLGILFGMGSSLVFASELLLDNAQNPEALMQIDWTPSRWLAGALAATPGVLGALFAFKD